MSIHVDTMRWWTASWQRISEYDKEIKAAEEQEAELKAGND